MLAAIYCRLSKEDEEKTEESESIQNQKALLTQYAREKGWDIYKIYCDENYSGIDQNRPEFCRMIAAAEKKAFDIILAKSQARFTRDMELVEKYIHHKFIEWDIRFVSLADHADTAVAENKKVRQIHGLTNEWYLEELSHNIQAVLNHKREKGHYIGNFPLYGYVKDPNDRHKLTVDFEAAEVVKKIYQLYLSGHGTQHIAALLNQEGIPNPTRYKQSKGFGYINGSSTHTSGFWNRTSVSRILREQMYTGDMVQGRRKKVSYKSKKLKNVPQKDWIIKKNTHEAIISREIFDTVQRMLQARTKTNGEGDPHLLAGKVKCMDCGSTMTRVSSTYKGEKKSYLRCRLYTVAPERCSLHSIRADLLEAHVVGLLKGYIQRYFNPACAERLTSKKDKSHRVLLIDKEIKKASGDADRFRRALQQLYLDKVNGTIGEEQFAELNAGFLKEKKAHIRRINQLHQEKAKLEGQPSDTEAIMQKIKIWLTVEKPPRALVVDFIEFIEVGQRNKETGEQAVRICWKI